MDDWYSTEEWIGIIWTSRFSGSLSILGSSLIITMMLRGGKEKLKRIHNRFLFALSFIDVLNSSALASSTAMIPRRYKKLFYGAVGNDVTCRIQGFFLLLGLAQPLYNSMLCLYYVAVIKYNVKDDVIVKYEKYMHAFAILPPLSGAIIGLSLGMINAGPLDYCGLIDDCTLKEIDPSLKCETKSSWYKTTRFVITLILLILAMIAFVIIIVSMGLVYCSVRSQALKMRRYSSFQRRNSLNGGENSKGNYHETMVQASMYVGAYLITYIWPLLLSFFPVKKKFFLLSFLNALFFPLQGFWNFITFIRPKFISVQEKKKDKSFWWILKAVILGTKLEDETPGANRRSSMFASPAMKRKQSTTSRRLEMIQRAHHGQHSERPPSTPSPQKVPDPEHRPSTLQEVSEQKSVSTRGDKIHDVEEAKEEISPIDYNYASNGTSHHQDHVAVPTQLFAPNDYASNEDHVEKRGQPVSPLYLSSEHENTARNEHGLEPSSNNSQISDSSLAAQEVIQDMIHEASEK